MWIFIPDFPALCNCSPYNWLRQPYDCCENSSYEILSRENSSYEILGLCGTSEERCFLVTEFVMRKTLVFPKDPVLNLKFSFSLFFWGCRYLYIGSLLCSFKIVVELDYEYIFLLETLLTMLHSLILIFRSSFKLK